MSVESRAENWTWRDDRYATLDLLSCFSDKQAVSIVWIWRFIYLSQTIMFLCFCCDKHAYIVGVYPSQTFAVFMYWDPQSVSENVVSFLTHPASSVFSYLPNMWGSCHRLLRNGATLVFKFFISSFAAVQTPFLMQPTPEKMTSVDKVLGKTLDETKFSGTGKEGMEWEVS